MVFVVVQPLEAPEGVGTIVHAEVQNMAYPVTLDTMYQVFSKFGPIIRIVTFVKNDKFQCLVQFHDNMAASTARMVCPSSSMPFDRRKCDTSSLMDLQCV